MSAVKIQHTLSVLVRDEPGVLTRIAGMFSRRGYNLKSLSVGASSKPEKPIEFPPKIAPSIGIAIPFFLTKHFGCWLILFER